MLSRDDVCLLVGWIYIIIYDFLIKRMRFSVQKDEKELRLDISKEVASYLFNCKVMMFQWCKPRITDIR